MTYLITFTCYGCHLHGCESGSVDREHNAPSTPLLAADPTRVAAEATRMDQPPYILDHARREAVLQTIHEVCAYRDWSLLASHVRSSHVHVVVSADAPPETIMGQFKAHASRRLNLMAIDRAERKRWTRHGSTRWLKQPRHISAAVHYVVHEQGEAMSVFESTE